MNKLRALLASLNASAAVEMALVLPIVMALLFGSVEVGKYFLDEHTVVEAVREGARYAARQPLDGYISATTGCLIAPSATLQTAVKNLVRTGTVDGTGSPRLSYWTSNATVEVTSSCYVSANSQTMSGLYNGIVDSSGAAVGAPVVQVKATVPYTSLFGLYTFSVAHGLNATEQAAASGV